MPCDRGLQEHVGGILLASHAHLDDGHIHLAAREEQQRSDHAGFEDRQGDPKGKAMSQSERRPGSSLEGL